MSRYDGVANGFLRFNKHEARYEFTPTGLDQLKELFEVGMTIEEVADFFVVDVAFIRASIAPNGEAHDIFRHASSMFKLAVRKAQLHLSDKSAQMAKHLGYHTLGQPVDPTPKDQTLEEKVVGTMPEWGGDTDEWAAKHKPKNDAGSTIEKLRRLHAESDEGEVDAESVTPDGPNDSSEAADDERGPEEVHSQASK